MFSSNKIVNENPIAKNLYILLGLTGKDLDKPPYMVYNEFSGLNDLPLGVASIGVPIVQQGMKNQLTQLLMNEWVKFHNVPQSVVDEWNRLTLAGADDNQKKTFWQKVKEAATNTFNTVSGGVNNVLEDAKDLGKNLSDKLNTFLNNAPQNVLFAPLLPFVPAMKNQLNKRGFSVSGLGIYDISKMFLEKIVKGSSNYQFAHLDPASIAAFAASPEGQNMVKQILDFFLTLANKPTLSSNDKDMLKDAEGGLDEILTPPKGFDVSSLLKYVAIAAALYFGYKLIFKK